MIELKIWDLYVHRETFNPECKFIFPPEVYKWVCDHANEITVRLFYFDDFIEVPMEKLTFEYSTMYSKITLIFDNMDDELYFKLAFYDTFY